MIYWSFDKIPELSEKTASEREAATKAVSNLVMKHWEWWVALLFACFTTGVGAWYGGVGVTGALGAGLGAAIGGGVLHVVGIYVARKYHAATLRASSAA
jgi:hypothetical protein